MRTTSIFALFSLLGLCLQPLGIVSAKGGGASAKPKSKAKAEDKKDDESYKSEGEEDEEEEGDGTEEGGDGEEVPPPTDDEDDGEEEMEGEEDDKDKEKAKAKAAATAKKSKLSRALDVAFGKADPLAADNKALTAQVTTLSAQLKSAKLAFKQATALLEEAGKQHKALAAVLADKLNLTGDLTAETLTAALDGKIKVETARDIAKAGVPARKLPQANTDETKGQFPAEAKTADQVAWVRQNRKAKEAAQKRPAA